MVEADIKRLRRIKVEYEPAKQPPFWKFFLAVMAMLAVMVLIFCSLARAETTLTASWYSVESLKREGTWKYSKGVMANGKLFKDIDMVCASCDYGLGDRLLISTKDKSVVVTVSDRTNKRFKGKRIDLSKSAFMQIANLKQGLISVKVEVLNAKHQ